MVERVHLYRAWSDENFCVPIFDPDLEGSTLEIVDRVVGRTVSGHWNPEPLTWSREKNPHGLPDLSPSPIAICCSQEAADRLWPHGAADFELLPVFVEDSPWYFLRCTRLMDEVVSSSSDVEWDEYVDAGKIIRRVSDVRWVTVCAPLPIDVDAFKLSISPWGWCYFTQSFVNRFNSLNLKGVYFEHCGYVVDKPENGVPPPARPVAYLHQAPRWPNWESAPEEEMAPLIQAGQAFLLARGLNETSEAAAILGALATEIEAHRAGFGNVKPKAKRRLLGGLSGAFGLLLRQRLQWNWVILQVTSRTWDLGLESPNGSHALCLNQVMVRQLTSPQPSTIELLFNMIAENNLPDGGAGDHVAIG